MDLREPHWEAVLLAHTWPFELRFLYNGYSQSFAANHNRAFEKECQFSNSVPEGWWILNPDVTWDAPLLETLLPRLRRPGVGAVYPRQLNDAGHEQDYARSLPTPSEIFLRLISRVVNRSVRTIGPPDWVNGACLLISGAAYERVGGFDEGFRLYVEDVDFCLRLRLAGYSICAAPDAVVKHDGQRRSHYVARHAIWHIRGLWRLWTSEAYRKYQMKYFRKHEKPK